MTRNVFSGRVHHNVRPKLDGVAQHGGGHGVIDDQGNAVGMGDIGNGGDI